MLDCPSTAPDYGADDDDGFGGAPAMDADVCSPRDMGLGPTMVVPVCLI